MPRNDEDDEYEDRPRRRRRRDEDEDDDEDDRPRRRRRDDEDDERPRGRRRDEVEYEDEDYDGEPVERKLLSRSDLRSIAGYQKGIIICILVYFCLIPAQFVIPESARIFLALALIPLGLTATVFVFLLATKVYSPALGAILGVLTLVPCIGLIVLLIINAKATGLLKGRGIDVGLLGARMSDI